MHITYAIGYPFLKILVLWFALFLGIEINTCLVFFIIVWIEKKT